MHLDTDGNGLKMNAYFVSHPEMVLGEMREVSGPYGMETACIPHEGQSLESLLAAAISHIHGEIQAVDLDDLQEEDTGYLPADPDVRNFSFAVVEGKLYFRENSLMRPVSVSATAEQRIRGLIGIRDCVRKLIEYQTEDYPEVHDPCGAGKLKYSLRQLRERSMAGSIAAPMSPPFLPTTPIIFCPLWRYGTVRGIFCEKQICSLSAPFGKE